jgi:hypothetical protein
MYPTHQRFRRTVAASLVAVLAGAAVPAVAKTPTTAQTPTVQLTEPRDARTTRDDFREILLQYGPALGRILRADPSLMTNEQYLTAYPTVAAFIQTHPEVVRDPEYFLANFSQLGRSSDLLPPELQLRSRSLDLWRQWMEGLMMFGVFLTIVLTLLYLIRYVVGHRRWLRATKVQSEIHGRLLERFGSNEELLAYIKSPAGRNFLSAAPIVTEEASGGIVSAPLGRILWSIQAGLVLASGGVGLLIIRGYVMEEVRELLLTLGGLALSVGAGFALAAGASYLISQRLGLFDESRSPTDDEPDRGLTGPLA